MNLVGRVRWTRRAGSLHQSEFLLVGDALPSSFQGERAPGARGWIWTSNPHPQSLRFPAPASIPNGGMLGSESGRAVGSANEYCLKNLSELGGLVTAQGVVRTVLLPLWERSAMLTGRLTLFRAWGVGRDQSGTRTHRAAGPLPRADVANQPQHSLLLSWVRGPGKGACRAGISQRKKGGSERQSNLPRPPASRGRDGISTQFS